MNANEPGKPLFMRTYSKVLPRSARKPKCSPVFPRDQPQGYGSSRRQWINVPTGQPSSPSSCSLSEISVESDITQPGKNTVQENSSDQESFMTIGHAAKQSRRLTSTPLINVGNILANKPRKSSFQRVASPFKHTGKKPRNKTEMLASIHESTDETDDDEQPRKNLNRSKLKAAKQKGNTVRPNRKIGWPSTNLFVRGRTVTPPFAPQLPGTSSVFSAATSEGSTYYTNYYTTSSDMPGYSDDTDTTLSGDTDADSTITNTEDMCTEEEVEDNTLKTNDDDIEIMRDMPETNALYIHGTKAPIMPKALVNLKNADPLKSPLRRLSLETSLPPSGRKQVSFLLSSVDREELPDVEMGKTPVQLPELAHTSSILKKSNTDSNDETFSSTLIPLGKKTHRMSSTPTRASKKQHKMLQFSFDVSAVPLPSYSDLVEHDTESTQPMHNTTAPAHVNKNSQKSLETKTASTNNLQPRPTCIPASDINLPVIQKQPIDVYMPKVSMDNSLPVVRNASSMHDESAPVPPTNSSSKISPVEATPRCQLKRSSPESHVPVTPSKRRSKLSWSDTIATVAPSSTEHQRKRLEYQDKAVGPPECCITKIKGSTCKYDTGVKVTRYATPHKLTYKQIQKMPTDVLELLFA